MISVVLRVRAVTDRTMIVGVRTATQATLHQGVVDKWIRYGCCMEWSPFGTVVLEDTTTGTLQKKSTVRLDIYNPEDYVGNLTIQVSASERLRNCILPWAEFVLRRRLVRTSIIAACNANLG